MLCYDVLYYAIRTNGRLLALGATPQRLLSALAAVAENGIRHRQLRACYTRLMLYTSAVYVHLYATDSV